MSDYKKDFEKSIDFIEWQNDMLKKQADRIAELEKFNKAILKKGGCDGNICKRYDTHPHKELSDEEIEQCFADACTEFKLLENGKTKGIVDIIAVGRAIIKASRGEE